jgi:transcriptional regulator with XRE-family HTH domain
MMTMAATPRLLRSTPPAKRSYRDCVAAQVRMLLGRQRLSTADLSELLNVSNGRALHIKAGRRSLTVDELHRLCGILEADMLELLGRAETDEGPMPHRDYEWLAVTERMPADLVELRRYPGGEWTVHVVPAEDGYTPHLARMLTVDLDTAQAQADTLNRDDRAPVDLEGRDLLLVSSEWHDLFSDGKPKRVVRRTTPDQSTDSLQVLDDSQRVGQTQWTRVSSAIPRLEITFSVIGRYELLLADPHTGRLLLSKTGE